MPSGKNAKFWQILRFCFEGRPFRRKGLKYHAHWEKKTTFTAVEVYPYPQLIASKYCFGYILGTKEEVFR
jgi:hypothetical protein